MINLSSLIQFMRYCYTSPRERHGKKHSTWPFQKEKIDADLEDEDQEKNNTEDKIHEELCKEEEGSNDGSETKDCDSKSNADRETDCDSSKCIQTEENSKESTDS